MADDDTDPSSGSQSSPWFTQKSKSDAASSTTPDDANSNIILNKIADSLGTQSTDVVAGLAAIVTALNAKPAA